MGKCSVKENKSVYQIARDEELGYSRLKAAEIIARLEDGRYSYLNENRLAKLEDGTAAIQPLDVVAMSKAYGKPELRNYYCCNECPIGKIDTPVVSEASNVHEILVNMAVSLESVNAKKIRLMEILADGRVDDDEMPDLNKILEELEKISMTVEAIQLWCEKMKIEGPQKNNI